MPVAEQFFEVMGLSPDRGRLPTADELGSGAPVAVVSQQAAQALWPDGEAIGQMLLAANGDKSWTVIGVVPDAQYATLGLSRFGQVYWPFDGIGPDATLVVRSSAAPSMVLAAAVARARSAGAEDELLRATTMREALGESIRHQRFRGWIFGVLAAAGLVVTMVGVLALIAMSTAQRTRELGVRVALGATQPSLLWTCIRQALALVLAGLVVGGVVSAWAVTLLRGYLFQVTEYDPRVWALAVGVVVAATGLGALLPAVRATRGNPVTALRAE